MGRSGYKKKGAFGTMKENTPARKSRAIDLYRYLFAIFICTLHFKEYYGDPYPFGGAYLGVEFFLILAGFFQMKHICTHATDGLPEEHIAGYFWSRVKRLYPQYAVGLAFYYIYRLFVTHTITVKQALIDFLPEWGMIQILGFGKWLNAAMWYVSAMLFASLVIYYFAVKNRKKFLYVLAPAALLLIYSWFYQKNHGLGGIGLNTRTLLICDGFWRALAGMLLGCLVYAAYDAYHEWIASHGKVLRTVLECVILALICIKFYRAGNTVADFTAVVLMALLVLSATSGGSYLTAVLDRIPVSGKYAYAMYCNHWTINYIIKEYFPGHSFYPTLAVYLCIVLALSVLTVFVIERAGAAIRHRTLRP